MRCKLCRPKRKGFISLRFYRCGKEKSTQTPLFEWGAKVNGQKVQSIPLEITDTISCAFVYVFLFTIDHGWKHIRIFLVEMQPPSQVGTKEQLEQQFRCTTNSHPMLPTKLKQCAIWCTMHIYSFNFAHAMNKPKYFFFSASLFQFQLVSLAWV